MSTSLPTPTTEAAQHSARLVEFIQRDIAAQGGWISFARYMELALYAPGLGYYTAGAHKFGAAGDFITALLAEAFLLKHPKSTVIYDLRASHAVKDLVVNRTS